MIETKEPHPPGTWRMGSELPSGEPTSFTDGNGTAADRLSAMATYSDVVLGDREGVVCVAFGRVPFRTDSGRYEHREWQDNVVRAWPAEREQLVRELAQVVASGEAADAYICPAVRQRNARTRRKGDAIPPQVLWADQDKKPADMELYAKLLAGGSLVIGSGSNSNKHIYLPLTHAISLGEFNVLNKALADRLDADKKWADNTLLRVPGTFNWKATMPEAGGTAGPPTAVKILSHTPGAWDPDELARLLGVDLALPSTGPTAGDVGTEVTAEPAPDPLPELVQRALQRAGTDRSGTHHGLIGACKDAGLTVGQALTVAQTFGPSVEKYGRRLATEVARSWGNTEDKREPGGVKIGESLPDDEEHVSVVPFPTLDPDALQGLPGEIVAAALPHTEAHAAAILVQYLARFGAHIGRSAHVEADNRQHHARLYPLIVGRTSSGAKGTSAGVVAALFGRAEKDHPALFGELLRRPSGLSSGEGLIELVRDGRDGDADDDDPGVTDKRLYVLEEEFGSVLAVMERNGSILPGVLRSAWDGSRLQTLTRSSPLCATDAHIVIAGHVTPGELRIKLGEAQMAGGTMNRFLPIASRRTKLLSDGGNLPRELLAEYAGRIAETVEHGRSMGWVERTAAATDLWRRAYPFLRKDRPDGAVATILARAAPQVLRLSLAYALADGAHMIGEQHVLGALEIWRYVEATAAWMFGAEVETGEVEKLVTFIAAGSAMGRSRTEITRDHFGNNKKAAETNAMLAELINAGRVRQEKDASRPGRPVFRYFAC